MSLVERFTSCLGKDCISDREALQKEKNRITNLTKRGPYYGRARGRQHSINEGAALEEYIS